MKLTIPWLLTIVFVVLKLCHVIDWSWWWVTVPLWGVTAVGLLVFGFAIAVHRYSLRTDPTYRLKWALENMISASRRRRP